MVATSSVLLLLPLLSVLPFPALALDYYSVDLRELVTSRRAHRRPSTTTTTALHQNEVRSNNNNNNDNGNDHVRLDLLHRDMISGRRNHSGSLHHLHDDLLRRDSRRVAALIRRLSAAGYHVDDFGLDVVSGLDQGSGEYFIRVGVGTPPRDQYLVVDSGSDVVWVQCQPCSECYPQSEPVFDPADSASFAAVSCGSRICDLLATDAGCRSGRCRYEVSYGDGSYTKGTLALETLTFGRTAVSGVAIGCGQRNRGLFVGAAGLLGLGWGPLSLVAQLGGQLGGAFSYCLASRGAGSGAAGSLVFGRSSAMPVGAVWVPLLRNPRDPSFYYVGVAGLGVGGVRLPLLESDFEISDDGDGGVVMDTGTAVTRLPDSAYQALRDAFVGATPALPRAPGRSIFDTCYDLFGYGSVRVPTVSFYFSGGTVLTLPARNFLVPVDGAGTFCFAFAPSPSALSIMGNIQQEGIQITFDAANGFVGFGPNTC